jgi:hypothetical protein
MDDQVVPSSLYCCEALAIALNDAGEKGLSVIPYSDGSRRRFLLQARPFPHQVLKRCTRPDPTTGVALWPDLIDDTGALHPYTAFLEMPLLYCPWCGSDLCRLIERDMRAFDAMAESMKEYLLE